MQEIYNEVPNIISSKDLDYLSDMFNWNYGTYKSSLNAANEVTDQELNEVLTHASNTFEHNLNKILNIINNGGSNE